MYLCPTQFVLSALVENQNLTESIDVCVQYGRNVNGTVVNVQMIFGRCSPSKFIQLHHRKSGNLSLSLVPCSIFPYSTNWSEKSEIRKSTCSIHPKGSVVG